MAAQPIKYPKGLGKKARDNLKETLLREKMDTLFKDTTRNGSICNLIFRTQNTEDWKAAILHHYPKTRESQWVKVKLDLPNRNGYVSIYPSGKIVIQGRSENLTEFANNFQQLRNDFEMRNLQRPAEELDINRRRRRMTMWWDFIWLYLTH